MYNFNVNVHLAGSLPASLGTLPLTVLNASENQLSGVRRLQWCSAVWFAIPEVLRLHCPRPVASQQRASWESERDNYKLTFISGIAQEPFPLPMTLSPKCRFCCFRITTCTVC